MKLLIGIVAGILVVPGFLALLVPSFAMTDTGLNPSTAGLTEVRATFGGLHIGFVIFLVWCWFSAERHRYALLAIALMLGGASLGRLSGIIIDGMPTILHYLGLSIETPLALGAVWLLCKQDSNSDPTDN